MTKYEESRYSHSFSDGCDEITVAKSKNSEWMQIIMKTNVHNNGMIAIRNQEQVEQLHFMLGQLLKGEGR